MSTLSIGEQAAGVARPPAPESRQESETVAAFCQRKGLDELLRQAILFAQETFSPVEWFEVEVRQNPEAAEEWVVLRVAVRGEQVNVSAARKEYTAKWIAFSPPESRLLIRLSPDIL
ncbi:MAG: hypothetical protein U0792_17530 [Gemmataceae bacterium]